MGEGAGGGLGGVCMAKKKATTAKKKTTTAHPPRPRGGNQKRPRGRGLGAGNRSRLQRDSAQSSSVAIRSRRNVHIKGSVIGRDYNVTHVIQMAAFTPPPDLKKLRKDYLEHLRRSQDRKSTRLNSSHSQIS